MPIMLMVGLEAAAAVLLVLGLVALRARRLGRTVVALEHKILDLRQRLRSIRADLKTALSRPEAVVPDFAEQLDAHIQATRNHHLTLNPDRDIVLDMAADATPERRAVSLRHAFLIAEKEAALAGENGAIDWTVLQDKLAQIIGFYEQPPAGAAAAPPEGTADGGDAAGLREVIENQKRHIENLERFKKLFFEADAKWQQVSREAGEYREQLEERGRGLDPSGEFNALLDRYAHVYDDFDAVLSADIGPRAAHAIEIDADKPSVGRMVIANQEEMQRLRNMAVDQHKMILHLRQELQNAHSIEAKDRVIEELQKQLERHERFLKESDLCMKQLEGELDRALDDNQSLKTKLLELKRSAEPEEAQQMADIIDDFTQQSGEMLNALETLEAECSDLRAQLAAVQQGGAADTAAMGELKQQLAAAQQELLNLQTQHIELEERYLELKSASL